MENGTLLNNTYQILRPIGSGGLGVIYLGYHVNLQKYVIIKKVKEHCTGLLNNRIEVDILKGLHHTYLPQVYDFIQMEDGIFTVMDYISGHDLKYYLDVGYSFSEEQLLFWMKQLCEVLEYLHSKGVVHCDIKPGNIMITDEGNICLIDFNISLDGENNKDLVGLSSSFASPEQVKKAEFKLQYGSGDGIKMDGRTDLYSVGAVFYYIITGIKPNVRKQEVEPLSSFVHHYSDSIANIVDKAMEKSPEKRFKSAEKMLEALEHQSMWTREYQWLLKAGAFCDGVAGCLMIFLICLVILGYRGMKEDAFFQTYDSFMEQAEDWLALQENEAAERLAADGIRILNNSNLTKLFTKYPLEKSNILFAIGQTRLHLEDYFEARKYLEEALIYNDKNPDIYCNLSICYARQGMWEETESSMDDAVYYGLSQQEGNVLQAEIALAKENYEEALMYAKEVMQGTDPGAALKAANIVLTVGEQEGYLDECVELLSVMSDKTRGNQKVIWLRKQAEFCMKAAKNGAVEYMDKAVTCYEMIQFYNAIQLPDLYNLASLYDDKGSLQTEKKLLLSMKSMYPEEYEIYLRLSYVCYRQQNNNAIKNRDYTEMYNYFKKSCVICEEQKIDWNNDVNMVQMSEIINQLQTQGWL